jgi:hypothetical protein
MGAFSLIDGFSMRPVIFLAVVTVLLVLLWFALTSGTYIIVEGDDLTVSRAFFKGRPTSLSNVVSIESRANFGGLFTEVYMKVRNKDGTFRNQGLINQPGLTNTEYKRLFDTIRSVNPNARIDESIFRK